MYKPALLSLALIVGGYGLSMAEERSITEQVVFLYYADLEEAAHFYESVMGFKKTYSLDWVKIYETNQGASIGIVDETKGFLKEAKDKPVMLSWVTDDVDVWYRYLKEKGVTIKTEPSDNQETGIRAFIFSDPGGYTLEFFAWTR
jgi:predicted enzyme related to lactoylglutathione lyase